MFKYDATLHRHTHIKNVYVDCTYNRFSNTFGNKAPIQRNVEASNLLSNLFKFKVKSGIFKQTSFGTNNKFYIDFSHNLSKQC